jgi:hypothetical protein
MVAPDPSKRFADAKIALESLKPLYVVRVPEIQFDKSTLKFKASSLGEKITQNITISNQVPETILEGYLEVAPHPNDPPHIPDNHAWISISQQKIQGNCTQCSITVDTSKLWAESQGSRQLIFKGNTESLSLTIQVETAPRPVKLPLKRYLLETFFTVVFIFIVVFVSYVSISLSLFPSSLRFDNTIAQIYFSSGLMTVIPVVNSLILYSFFFSGLYEFSVKYVVALMVGSLFLSGAMARIIDFSRALTVNQITYLGVFVSTFFSAPAIMGARLLLFTEHYDTLPKLDKRCAYIGFWLRYLLSTLCGIPLSWHITNIFINVNPEVLKFLKPPTTEQVFFSTLALLVAGAALIYVSLLPILEHRRQLAAYRTQEQKLIKP